MTMAKYIAPAVEVVGSVRGLTQGTSNGNNLDSTFPTGTPRGDLTFS
jgi:hypothetical protein